jgi:hypothetical protein
MRNSALQRSRGPFAHREAAHDEELVAPRELGQHGGPFLHGRRELRQQEAGIAARPADLGHGFRLGQQQRLVARELIGHDAWDATGAVGGALGGSGQPALHGPERHPQHDRHAERVLGGRRKREARDVDEPRRRDDVPEERLDVREAAERRDVDGDLAAGGVFDRGPRRDRGDTKPCRFGHGVQISGIRGGVWSVGKRAPDRLQPAVQQLTFFGERARRRRRCHEERQQEQGECLEST